MRRYVNLCIVKDINSVYFLIYDKYIALDKKEWQGCLRGEFSYTFKPVNTDIGYNDKIRYYDN